MVVNELLIDEIFLDSLFTEEFDLIKTVNKDFDLNPAKIETSIGEFKNNLSALEQKSKQKDAALSKFIERLTIQLYNDINYLKTEINSPNELTIFEKHDQMVSIVDQLSAEFNKLNYKNIEEENINHYSNQNTNDAVEVLKQLNNVRSNLEVAINSLTEFNNLINKDDNKKIISAASMQNELKQRILEKNSFTLADITNFKKQKDILKDFDKLYVIYTNFLIELEGTSDEIAEISIQHHF
ncbi:hypothetical protein QEN19_001637 [Hanseniaspora menglaensis]